MTTQQQLVAQAVIALERFLDNEIEDDETIEDLILELRHEFGLPCEYIHIGGNCTGISE